LLLASWAWGLWGVGADRDQGEVYRIIFVHVPVAWCAFVWVIAGAVFGVRALLQPTKAERFDRSSQSSMELGTLFAALALITGSIWGRPTWGRWWDWDPRLTSTLVMFLITCGYHILRSFTPDVKSRRTVAGVVALLSALNVPIVYFSVNLWRSIHQPQSFVTRASNVSSDISQAMWLNVLTMLVFSIAVYIVRRQSIAARETLEVLRAEHGAG
jgi:heme exporter protein C